MFARQAGASLTSGRVLDAGAGSAPYHQHFSHLKYEAADICKLDKKYHQLSFICDLSALPIRAESYDLVFCTQTLEHLPYPRQTLKEFARVLTARGRLWITAPFYYEEHEIPYDFFRYTRYGLEKILTDAGFHIVAFDWLEGYYGTLGYQLEVAARNLPRHPSYYGVGFRGVAISLLAGVLRIIFAASSLLFSRMDLIRKVTDHGHCKNYAVVAERA